jgi:hypothetical protein
LFKRHCLTAGISWSGKERKAMRCEHREFCATPSGARKTKVKRWKFARVNQAVVSFRLGGLFRAGFVEILA